MVWSVITVDVASELRRVACLCVRNDLRVCWASAGCYPASSSGGWNRKSPSVSGPAHLAGLKEVEGDPLIILFIIKYINVWTAVAYELYVYTSTFILF